MGLFTYLALSALLGGAAVATIMIYERIQKKHIQKEVKKDDAIYALIKNVQPDSVSIEEIDSYGDSKEKVLKSDEGVSGDLYEGQKIRARA